MTKGILPLLVTVFFLALNFFQQYAVICFLIFCVGLIAGALYPVALALIGEIVPPEKNGNGQCLVQLCLRPGLHRRAGRYRVDPGAFLNQFPVLPHSLCGPGLRFDNILQNECNPKSRTSRLNFSAS